MATTSGLVRIAWLARPGALGANQISAAWRGHRHEAGVEPALLLSRPRARGGVGLADGGERRLRLLHEGLARRGDGHPAGVALEQSHADLRLESRDRLRERRLRQLEAPGRTGHLTLLHHRHEVAQLSEVELAQLPHSSIRDASAISSRYSRPG